MNSQDFIYERTFGSLFILLPDNENYDPYSIEKMNKDLSFLMIFMIL